MGAQEGSSAVDALKKKRSRLPEFKDFKTFGDNITALMDLSTGRLDAVVVDEVVGCYYVAKKPQDYVVLEAHFGTEDYGVGVSQGRHRTAGQARQGTGRHEGRWRRCQIAEQWFGKNIIKAQPLRRCAPAAWQTYAMRKGTANAAGGPPPARGGR